MPAFDL